MFIQQIAVPYKKGANGISWLCIHLVLEAVNGNDLKQCFRYNFDQNYSCDKKKIQVNCSHQTCITSCKNILTTICHQYVTKLYFTEQLIIYVHNGRSPSANLSSSVSAMLCTEEKIYEDKRYSSWRESHRHIIHFAAVCIILNPNHSPHDLPHKRSILIMVTSL